MDHERVLVYPHVHVHVLDDRENTMGHERVLLIYQHGCCDHVHYHDRENKMDHERVLPACQHVHVRDHVRDHVLDDH